MSEEQSHLRHQCCSASTLWWHRLITPIAFPKEGITLENEPEEDVTINERSPHQLKPQAVPKELTIIARMRRLKFCLKTYFALNRTIYEQLKGTPMGSPISGLIAEAVLQQLESLVFRQHEPNF
ncbi:unnamed protein product [Dibothriocephalus latus]|uniref:Reverse transcriptase domain-containing protein n=1 Tax=Dibothriocephalus latus TaxID=60516 RepID=A0A3P7L8S7_DIBLA|nr:unnamed protein product [Dibothriocephalus latus]